MTSKALEAVPELTAKKNLVRDWMSTPPITILPDAHVTEAYALMQERHIRRLPVVENGHLLGIITMGDLREVGASLDNDQATKIRVDFAMNTQPITATPTMSLRNAAKSMIQHKISGLPVISDGVLVGMITESDIFRAFLSLT